MTREDVMRMAAEAGVSPINDQQIKFEGPMWLCLDRFAALVAAHEREACAKLCDHEMAEQGYGSDGWHIAKALAKTIRARGKEVPP